MQARLQDIAAGECIADYSTIYPYIATCSASEALEWKLQISTGGTFTLVNSATGKCLGAPFTGDNMPDLEACSGYGGTGYVYWHIGSSTTQGQTLKNNTTSKCLEITPRSSPNDLEVIVTTCDPNDPRQLWKNPG